jgi:hypothetical protein
MYFPFNCLGCGHENHAEWSQIGRRVICLACGRAAIVPAPMEPVHGESRSGLAVRFACPVCGRNFATRPALIGQKIRCSGCMAGVRVPEGNSFPVEYASRVVLDALSGSSRAIPPATGPTSGVRPPAGHRTPGANPWRVPRHGNSGSSRPIVPATGLSREARPLAGQSTPVASAFRVLPDGDSGNSHPMAPAAGVTLWAVEDDSDTGPSLSTDQLEAIGSVSRREHAAVVLPSRGETMEQVRQEVAQQEAAETTKNAEKAKKAKKKQRKKAGYFDLKETLTMVGGMSVVVGVLAFLAWFFPEFRFPLAGLLVVIGAVLYLLGAMSLGRLASNEGFLKSMAYRFFPPYQMWFVVTRWRETQDYFAFFLSGLVTVLIGLAVFRTSPTFKDAEDSDRAYQAVVDEFVRGNGAQPPLVLKKTDNGKN